MSLMLVAGGGGIAQQVSGWVQNPDIQFTQGIPGVYDLDDDVGSPSAALIYGVDSGALPSGVTMEGARKNLVTYDGIGALDAGVSVTFYYETGLEQADWEARISGANVVWFHDFRADAEVDQFRWIGGQGNDPNSIDPGSAYCRRVSSDGPTGNCLEIYRPAGSSEVAGWWRPFSPLDAASTGKGAADPAANGSLTARAWDSSNPSQNGQWTYGYYGHADYHSGDTWDGEEFYIQFRVKFSASRWTGGNASYDGKLAFIGVTGLTPTQELLIQSKGDMTYGMYTAFGSPGPLEFLNDPQGETDPTLASQQPGGAYAASCKYPNINPANCWGWDSDSWHTVLIKVTPGHGPAGQWGAADNGIEVWVARAGETSYTKIWDKLDYQLYFDTRKPIGWNAFQPSSYHNGQTMPQDFYQRYTQIIFSKSYIECPQA